MRSLDIATGVVIIALLVLICYLCAWRVRPVRGEMVGYISFTTTPDRLKHNWMHDNWERLLDIAPSNYYIILHIPEVSLSGVKYEIPERVMKLGNNSRFIINRNCTDRGPITKCMPVFSLSYIKDTDLIVVIDDDTCYIPEIFPELAQASREHPHSFHTLCDDRIFGFQGYAFQKALLKGIEQHCIPQPCTFIDDDFMEYYVKSIAKLPINVVLLGGTRECSFDTKLTYRRPQSEWSMLSRMNRHPLVRECQIAMRQLFP